MGEEAGRYLDLDPIARIIVHGESLNKTVWERRSSRLDIGQSDEIRDLELFCTCVRAHLRRFKVGRLADSG